MRAFENPTAEPPEKEKILSALVYDFRGKIARGRSSASRLPGEDTGEEAILGIRSRCRISRGVRVPARPCADKSRAAPRAQAEPPGPAARARARRGGTRSDAAQALRRFGDVPERRDLRLRQGRARRRGAGAARPRPP